MTQTQENSQSNTCEPANAVSRYDALSPSDILALLPAIPHTATHANGGNYQAPTVSANNDWVQGRAVSRSPEQLRPHPTLVHLNMVNTVLAFNEIDRLNDQRLREPLLITPHGIIISGFQEWKAALLDGRESVDCIEYSLSDEEAIQFVLLRHRSRQGWNSFNRIRLALELEPHFQAKALENQRAGGKFKGWANLPKAEQMDVRKEIAAAAGVGSRNVSNVKTILQKADLRLVEALQMGTLTINRAIQWCGLTRSQQIERFTKFCLERATSKVVNQSVTQKIKRRSAIDCRIALDALQVL
jgi:hypothetical protein